ncbi:trypsin Tyr p 3.0101-like [Amyelois transitella]|uniref:trypsin Tyr p 3.0101-like n=1 Tax=Amyelois transitella TaxID=680683 RepID=UPI002990313C|nr:trypsin Tyr p 3.0101-like [Amyelois transitella]
MAIYDKKHRMRVLIIFRKLTTVFKIVRCELNPFITGGNFVKYNKYPHSVYIVFACNFRFLCGGSVLNQAIILTSAHCFEGCDVKKYEKVEVKYGHEKITNMKSVNMKKFVLHEKFDDSSLIHDVSLLLTVKNIPLSNSVKRVVLMKRPPTAEYAYVSGWGMDEKNKLQAAMKHTYARIQKTEVCKSMGSLPWGVFCAGPLTGVGAADEGDSGGALVVNDCIQIGLVSYKVRKLSLVAYTNVSLYLDWIKKHARALRCSG